MHRGFVETRLAELAGFLFDVKIMLNKDLDPIQENLFEYDFRACSYNILKNIGYDISKINFDDKIQRNIQIGLLQRENPAIKTFINSQMKSLIELYIRENKLNPEEIVWRQKDGFIITRVLEIDNITVELTFRDYVSKLISSMKRDKVLIIYGNNKIDIKGFSNKPIDLSFFDLFLKIDFSNKKKILYGCDYIRELFFKSDNIKWFTRESKEKELTIPLKGDILLNVNKSMLSSIDPNDVDKKVIFEMYIYPFFQTLLICYNQ